MENNSTEKLIIAYNKHTGKGSLVRPLNRWHETIKSHVAGYDDVKAYCGMSESKLFSQTCVLTNLYFSLHKICSSANTGLILN